VRRRGVLAVARAAALAGCTPEGDPIDLPLPGAGPTVVAEGIAFEPATLTILAGVPTTLTLENRDQGVPHAIGLEGVQPGALDATSEVVIGPDTTTLALPPFVPARYRFFCPVHPIMIVDVIAEG
jgi:plastocyanin